jgi:DnaJ-class molecular chaperone
MRARYCSGVYAAYTKAADNYDVEWMHTISPGKAEAGCIVIIYKFKITIPPRTKDGTRMRLRGKGAQKPDGTMGDAYLTISVPQRPDQSCLADFKDDA